SFRLQLISLFGLIVDTVVILLLPAVRGYPLLRADFGSHIARSSEIASTMTISTDVFYPALYAAIQIFNNILHFDSRTLWFLGTVFVYVLRVLATVLAATTITDERKTVVWAGLLAALPAAGGYLRTLSPANTAVSILP